MESHKYFLFNFAICVQPYFTLFFFTLELPKRDVTKGPMNDALAQKMMSS